MLQLESKIILSWSDVEKMIDTLCEKIKHELPNIDSVHGIARGGLIPAILISHKLELPWSNVILPNTLVVDDICDSGETLNNCVGVYTATLHYKKSAITKPDIYAELLEDESKWIIYPWEKHDSEPIRDNTWKDSTQNKSQKDLAIQSLK